MSSCRWFACSSRCLLALASLALALGCASSELEKAHEAEEAAKAEAHATVDEAMHHEGGDPSEPASSNPLVTDPDLAIYTAIVFGILVLLLGKFAWKPIAEGLDRRENSILEQISAAERTNAEARNLLAQYEKRLAAAQDEVRTLLDNARRDATQASQEIHAKATVEAEAIKDRALRDIETAKGSALKELAEQSGRLAVDLAGRIIHAELDPARHNRLIEEALARFPVTNGNRG